MRKETAINSFIELSSKVKEHYIPESDLRRVYQLDYDLRIMKSSKYRRYRHFINYLFDKIDRRNNLSNNFELDKPYKFSDVTLKEILEYTQENFRTLRANFGWARSAIEGELEIVYEGETTKEYQCDVEGIFRIASYLTDWCNGDSDYFEKHELFEGN